MNHDVAGIRGKTPVEESSQAFTEETPATQAGATAASATTGPAGGSKLGTAAPASFPVFSNMSHRKSQNA